MRGHPSWARKIARLRVHPRCYALNRALMMLCLHLSSFNEELKMPAGLWSRLLDRLTYVWSCVILVTSAAKFAGYPTRDPQLRAAARPSWRTQLGEILLLNYLPRINQFSSLYYGLILLSVGTAFAWRTYLKFFRAAGAGRQRAFDGKAQFCAKRELMDFFLEGPHPEETQKRHLKTIWRHASLKRPRSRARSSRRNAALLSSAHTGHPDRRALAKCLGGLAQALEEVKQSQKYGVPIRGADFLYDKSQARWNFLATHVYLYVLLLVVTAIPIVRLSVASLLRVNEAFGSAESPVNLDSLADMRAIARGAGRPDDNLRRVNLCLGLYGLAEQAYTISQLTMFMVFSNIVVKLIHADLLYKVRPIHADFEHLRAFYAGRSCEGVSMEAVQRQQVRVWAYFDQIQHFDSFLSRYGIAALTKLWGGLSFGPSFFSVLDDQLKLGTMAALFGNFLSFSYFHFISDHIERQSLPIQSAILAILAAEKSPEAKHEWQRLLRGFFRSDFKRTFTMNGKYPTNLRTFSKTVTALLAACALIHRLFHKVQWNMSFVSPTEQPQETPTLH